MSSFNRQPKPTVRAAIVGARNGVSAAVAAPTPMIKTPTVSPPLPPPPSADFCSSLDARGLLSLLCVAMNSASISDNVNTTVSLWGPIAVAALAKLGTLERQRDDALAEALNNASALKRESAETRSVLTALATAATDTRFALDEARILDAKTRAEIVDLRAQLLLKETQMSLLPSTTPPTIQPIQTSDHATTTTPNNTPILPESESCTSILAENRAEAADLRAYDSERAVAAAKAETNYWLHRAERAEALAEQLTHVIQSQNDALSDAAYAGEDRLRVSDADWRRARLACGLITQAEVEDEIVADAANIRPRGDSDGNDDNDDFYESIVDTPISSDNDDDNDVRENIVNDDEANDDDDDTTNNPRLQLRGELLLHAFGARAMNNNARNRRTDSYHLTPLTPLSRTSHVDG